MQLHRGIAALFLCLVAPLQSADTDDLRPAAVLAPGVDPALRSAAGAAQPGGRLHAFLGVQGDLTAERRAALRAHGIAPLEWRESGVYTASLPAQREFIERAASDPLLLARLGLSAIASIPPASKISPLLTQPARPVWIVRDINGQPSLEVEAVFHPDVETQDAVPALHAAGWPVLSASAHFRRARVQVPERQLFDLARLDFIAAVEPAAPPRIELDNALSAEVIHAKPLLEDPYNLTGKDVRVGIWDSERVASHPDFGDRLRIIESSSYVSDHATHVAGTIAGSGESDPALRGVAPQARIYSGNTSGDIAEKVLRAIQDHQVTLSNNSWGYGFYGDSCTLFGHYLLEARDYDRIVKDHPLTVVFSMGNDRAGAYCPVVPTRAGFYSTSVPASAKNVIAVAAVNRDGLISSFSSYGPTRDGRLKPDISALGVDVRSLAVDEPSLTASGTSMSAPAITGALALLTERLTQRHSMAAPKPELLKALLLNSASDLGNAGPDYSYGYGLADLTEAVKTVDETQFALIGEFTSEYTRTLQVPAGAPALRVMLVYNDEPAPLNSRGALVNDLDLSLSGPGLEGERLPLTLDPKLPGHPAQPAENRRDNVEQVVVLEPQAGEYTVRIKAFRLATENQPFALAWSFAPLATPPCNTVLSPSSLSAGQLGGAALIGITRPAHCEAVELENPTHWIKPSFEGPFTGTSTMKLNIAPTDEEGTRHTLLRLGGADLTVKQSGPCVAKPLPETLTIDDELTLYDCLRYSSYITRLYTFPAEAGQKVRIEMQSEHFRTDLEIRAPNGSLLDISSYSPSNNSFIPEEGFLTLPWTGLYTIAAAGAQNGFGPFNLKVEFGEREDAEGRPDRPVLLTECPAAIAGQLGGNSTDGGRRGDLYLTDSYLFRGYPGQKVEIKVTDAAFDSYVYLISPFGGLYAQNDDAPGEPGSLISAILNEGGLWRIEVTSFSPFAEGAYSLQVQGCAAQ